MSIIYYVVILFIPDVTLFVDVPAGVTQEEGHTEVLHLPSAVLAFLFIARRIQPSPPFPSSTVKSSFVYPRTNRSALHLLGIILLFLLLFFVSMRTSNNNITLEIKISKQQKMYVWSSLKIVYMSYVR